MTKKVTDMTPEEYTLHRAQRIKYEHAYRDRNPERFVKIARKKLLKADYGMTVAEFNAKLLLQDGVCAICRRPETRTLRGKLLPLCVDHNHSTGTIRDLLCHKCNSAFGMLYEDPMIIANMLAYARKHEDL